MNTRIGIGIDVHPLVTGRALILGGVTVPWSHGLEGHSDADVLSHAIADALLGAAALGDLGQHFPSGESRWQGVSSLEFLRQVLQLLMKAGWRPGNIDAVILAEEPRLAPHIPAMRTAVAGALQMDMGEVSIKATTTDHLGLVGRQEGMAAQAVALIQRSGPVPGDG
jgi:2-C-methyl-D-erythritol 2,4-cyclodiphosphate synthase